MKPGGGSKDPSLDATVAPSARAVALDDTVAPTSKAPSFDDTVAPNASDPSLDATALPKARDPSLDATQASDGRDTSFGDTVELRGTLDAATPGTRISGPLAEDLHLAVGSRVGRYVVVSKLGEGGMGVVLAAYDPELDRKVAIKLVRPGSSSDGLRARMVREAQAMARLAHPNVIGVFDVGTVGEDVFVALELIEGVTLTSWLTEQPRSRRDVLAVFGGAGKGLAAAHAAGIVHRDFKPDNVMIGRDGRARVMDFGLARSTGVPERDPEQPRPKGARTHDIAPRTSALNLELTRAGAVLGTPIYMAPEQWNGEPADARSDQYAFCVALWEALYGVRPFAAETLDTLQTKVLEQPPDPPPADVRLPRRLAAAVRRGLEKDPAARFATMDALLIELAHEPIGRRGIALVGIGVVGLGAVVASFALRGGASDRTAAACGDPTVQLAAVWDPPRKAAVEAAVLATKVPSAPKTWALLEHQLETRAQDYMRVFAPTCRGEYRVAEHLRGAQTACLAHVRAELATFTEALIDIKPKEVDHVVAAVWGLGGTAPCEDAAVLGTTNALPSDPKIAVQVGQARDLLARALALKLAGRGKPALAAAEDALARAQKLDYPPLLGQAQSMVGGIAAAMGDDARGETLLHDSYTVLLAAGDDQGAASAAIHLGKLVGYDHQRAAAAGQWMEQAAALIKRTGSPVDLELERLSAAGMLRYAAGDLDGARPFFEQSIALANKALAVDDPRRAVGLNNLAGVLMGKGELDAAATMSRQSLELTRRALGPDHPDVAETLQNLGMILGESGHLEEAEADERDALARRERLLGPDHPDVVISLFNLGSILFKENKFEEARTVAERALALATKLHGEDHPDTADAVENLADVTEHLGDRARARALHERVLAIRQKVLEPGHPDIQRAKDSIARLAASPAIKRKR